MSIPSTNVPASSRSPSPGAHLRLGVVLDSLHVPGWIEFLVDQLTNCNSIDLFLIVLNHDAKETLETERGPFLFRYWTAVDRWVRRSATNAIRVRNWHLILTSRSIPVVVLQASKPKTLSDSDIAPIKAANLELLLCLGRDVPSPELLACASLSTWSVQDSGSGGILGQFWDMYEGNRVTLHGPQITEQQQNRTRVVYRSCIATNFLSLALNQNDAYWEIADVLVKQLADAEQLRTVAQLLATSDQSQEPISRTLSNTRMASFLVKWTLRTLRAELMKLLFREQWSIAIQSKVAVPQMSSDREFRIMRPPRDRFYADPFIIERNGRNYLFFEDYRFSSRKGLISCCEVDSEGNYTQPRVVLECDYHLSYPFLFTWQGEIYMIPETRDNRTIEMYRATDFPCSWVHEAVLMSDVAAVDTTLLHHRDRWWMFTAGVLDEDAPDKTWRLCLFFGDSPFGPWTAHPKNPIVSSVRHARPAGSMYFDNGQLIRPAQDCSRGYGYAVQLHRVEVLSETDYQESLLATVTPNWIPGSKGVHTFNQNADLRVIDVMFSIPRFGFNLFPAAQRSKTCNALAFEAAKSSR